MLVPRERIDREELLDQQAGSEQDAAESLADLRRINRYLGGISTLMGQLEPRLAALGPGATVLDVGTGSADLPLAVARWARRRGRVLRVIGVDLTGRHLKVARA